MNATETDLATHYFIQGMMFMVCLISWTVIACIIADMIITAIPTKRDRERRAFIKAGDYLGLARYDAPWLYESPGLGDSPYMDDRRAECEQKAITEIEKWAAKHRPRRRGPSANHPAHKAMLAGGAPYTPRHWNGR